MSKWACTGKCKWTGKTLRQEWVEYQSDASSFTGISHYKTGRREWRIVPTEAPQYSLEGQEGYALLKVEGCPHTMRIADGGSENWLYSLEDGKSTYKPFPRALCPVLEQFVNLMIDLLLSMPEGSQDET